MANNSELNVSVTFRHTEPTDALKKYAAEKVVHCLSKYISGPGDGHVVLSIEKRDHSAEVNVHSKLYNLSSKSTTGDLYSAIDKVVDTLDAQMRKQKERMLDQKHTPAPE